MSSFLSPPHPHNLSPVRSWELGGESCRAGSTGTTRMAEREVGHLPQLSSVARGWRRAGVQCPVNGAQHHRVTVQKGSGCLAIAGAIGMPQEQ